MPGMSIFLRQCSVTPVYRVAGRGIPCVCSFLPLGGQALTRLLGETIPHLAPGEHKPPLLSSFQNCYDIGLRLD